MGYVPIPPLAPLPRRPLKEIEPEYIPGSRYRALHVGEGGLLRHRTVLGPPPEFQLNPPQFGTQYAPPESAPQEFAPAEPELLDELRRRSALERILAGIGRGPLAGGVLGSVLTGLYGDEEE